jgi:hypothetical protein
MLKMFVNHNTLFAEKKGGVNINYKISITEKVWSEHGLENYTY